jgi:hypothetical protein
MFKKIKIAVLVICMTLIGTSMYGTMCIYNKTDFDVKFYFKGDVVGKQGPFTIKKRKDKNHATCVCTKYDNVIGLLPVRKTAYYVEAKDVPGEKKGWSKVFSQGGYNKYFGRYVTISTNYNNDGTVEFSVSDKEKKGLGCSCKCVKSEKGKNYSAKGEQVKKSEVH